MHAPVCMHVCMNIHMSMHECVHAYNACMCGPLITVKTISVRVHNCYIPTHTPIQNSDINGFTIRLMMSSYPYIQQNIKEIEKAQQRAAKFAKNNVQHPGKCH